MKLASIINVFDGDELLPYAMFSVNKHIDLFIIVWQDISNFGEEYKPNLPLVIQSVPMVLHKYTPKIKHGAVNEIKKRNIGLDIAREYECTHYFWQDCDEIYDDFESAKLAYINSGHAGSVCPIWTYFKKPTWRLEQPDNYFVPFIHELKSDTEAGGFNAKSYPKYVDPTRATNETDVIELPHFMHHMSWVRKDIMMKVRNSSARENIYKGKWVQDYEALTDENVEGYYLENYKQKLTVVPNLFNIEL